MKKILFQLIFISYFFAAHAQVGVNTTTPSNGTAFEVNSSFGGGNYGAFMPPRVTIAQRDLIPVTAADDGLMAYVSGFPGGERCLQLFNGMTMTWESIQCFGVPPPPVTLFFETMGTVASNTNTNVHQANGGFDNSATCGFVSTTSSQSQVRNSTFSTVDIPSASGSANLYFANGNRDFTISGINATAGIGPLTLEMLIYKGTSVNPSNGSELIIEYFNGTAWVNVSVSNLPTGAGSNMWYQRTLATNVPNTISQIRISRATVTNSPVEFRVDDIKIIQP
jgi:hypothetical protein